MFEYIVDIVADAVPPALVLLWLIGFIWQMKNYKKRFPGRSFFSFQPVNWRQQEKTCSGRIQEINAGDVGSLTRESMFKDQDSYRLPQDTAFDRPYTFDQPAYMEHNINGVPMMGGVDLHGNPFGTDH
jgi:hypothetical protein